MGQLLILEHRRDGRDDVGEDVQVDVRALADVAGQNGADEARRERATAAASCAARPSRISRRCSCALFAFIEVGEGLDLVADFGVGGEVAGLDAIVSNASWRAALRLAVKYSVLVPFVHQLRREQRDLASDSCISHVLFSPRLSSPDVRRWAELN